MKQRRDIVQLLLNAGILLLLNFIGSFFFARFDLTSDKRYTLSPATKKLLSELNDVVYFKIYLDGKLPAGFDRMKDAVREMLDEFRIYSANNIEYRFIDPLENSDKKKQQELARQLMEKGLTPTFVEVQEEKGLSQQIIFPGAIASFGSREFPVQLFKEQIGIPGEMVLNNSIQLLEYEFSTIVRKLTMKKRKKIALATGHNELDSVYTSDMAHALGEFYSVKPLKLSGKIKDLKKINGYDAVIIAKPDSVFSEQNKFILDQFIMQGGKVLWLLDAVLASMDSLTHSSETFAVALPLNLENQLFKYGVRINHNIVMDLRSGAIPVPVNNNYRLAPWHYFPLLAQSNNHPIVNNLNLVKTEFPSTIDTIRVPGIRKTPLLSTSRYTRVLNVPARIDLRSVLQEPDTRFYNRPFQTIAVLLEGEFESLYKNYPLPGLDSISEIKFKDKSVSTKMIVCADGDIVKNAVQHSTGRAYPLGYDIYTRQTYGNKNFILNAVNYLCDDSGLLQVRSREVKLRLLDRKKISEEKTKWQTMNIVLPVVVVMLFGMLNALLRKRKFTK